MLPNDRCISSPKQNAHPSNSCILSSPTSDHSSSKILDLAVKDIWGDRRTTSLCVRARTRHMFRRPVALSLSTYPLDLVTPPIVIIGRHRSLQSPSISEHVAYWTQQSNTYMIGCFAYTSGPPPAYLLAGPPSTSFVFSRHRCVHPRHHGRLGFLLVLEPLTDPVTQRPSQARIFTHE